MQFDKKNTTKKNESPLNKSEKKDKDQKNSSKKPDKDANYDNHGRSNNPFV